MPGSLHSREKHSCDFTGIGISKGEIQTQILVKSTNITGRFIQILQENERLNFLVILY